ncbi:hypothetical protein FRB96_003958 [Tulasnella sp. 330]|nr:hypothetical protein FRB96_003958 [Tulasnella sp. 330]KAG8881061.1 hypothetical protein FRB98_004562 [Tulasnella sp. 332]
MSSTRLSWSSVSSASSISDLGTTAATLSQFQPPPTLPLQLRPLEQSTRLPARAARTSYSATHLLGSSKSTTHLSDKAGFLDATGVVASSSTSNLSNERTPRGLTQPGILTSKSATNLSENNGLSGLSSHNEPTPRGGRYTTSLPSEEDPYDEDSLLPWAVPKSSTHHQRDASPLNLGSNSSRPSLPSTPSPQPSPASNRKPNINLPPPNPRANRTSNSPNARPGSSSIGAVARGLPLQSRPFPPRPRTTDIGSGVAGATAAVASPSSPDSRHNPSTLTAPNASTALPSSFQRPSSSLPQTTPPKIVTPLKASPPTETPGPAPQSTSIPAPSVRPRRPSVSNTNSMMLVNKTLGVAGQPTTPISPLSPGAQSQAQTDMKRLMSKPTQLASVHNNSSPGVLSAGSSVDSAGGSSRFGFGDYGLGRGHQGGAPWSPDTPLTGLLSPPSAAETSEKDRTLPAVRGRSRGPSLASMAAPSMSMLQQAQRSRAKTYTGVSPNPTQTTDLARHSNLPMSRTFGDLQRDVPEVSLEESEEEAEERPPSPKSPNQSPMSQSTPQQQRALTPASAIILAYQQQHASSSTSLRAPSSHGSGSRGASPRPSTSPSPIPSTASSRDVEPIGAATGQTLQPALTRSSSRSRSRATSLKVEKDGGAASRTGPTEPLPVVPSFLPTLMSPAPPTLPNGAMPEAKSAVDGGSKGGVVRRLSRKISGKFSLKKGDSPIGKGGTDDSPNTINGPPVIDFMGGIAQSAPCVNDEVIPPPSPATAWVDEEGRWQTTGVVDDYKLHHIDSYPHSSASSASRSHLPSMNSSSSYKSTRQSQSGHSDSQSHLPLPSPPLVPKTPSTPNTTPLPPIPAQPPQKEAQRSRLRTSMSKSFLRITSASSSSSPQQQQHHHQASTPPTPLTSDVPGSPSASGSTSPSVGGSIWRLMKKFSTSTLRKGDLQSTGGDADGYVPPVPKLPPGISGQARSRTMGSAPRGDDSDEEDFGKVLKGKNEFGFGNYGYASSTAGSSSAASRKSGTPGRIPRSSTSTAGRSRSGTVISTTTSASISHFPFPPPPPPPIPVHTRHKQSLSQSRTVATTTTGASGMLSSSPSDNSSSRHFWKGNETMGSPRTSTSSYTSDPVKAEDEAIDSWMSAMEDRTDEPSVENRGLNGNIDTEDKSWMTAPRSPALRPTHAAATRSTTSLSLPKWSGERADSSGTLPNSPPLPPAPPTPPFALANHIRSSSTSSKSSLRAIGLLPSLPLRGEKPSPRQSPPNTAKKGVFQRLGRSTSGDVQTSQTPPGRSHSGSSGLSSIGLLRSPAKFDRPSASQTSRGTGISSSSMDVACIGIEPPRAAPPIPTLPPITSTSLASSMQAYTMTHIPSMPRSGLVSPPQSPMTPSTPGKQPMSPISFKSAASPNTPGSLATIRGVVPHQPLVLTPANPMTFFGSAAASAVSSPPMSPLSPRSPMSPTSPTMRWSFDERRESADSKDRRSGGASTSSRNARRASMDSSPVSKRLSLNGNSSSSSGAGQTVAFRELKSSSVIKRTEDEKVAMWDKLMERSEKAGGTLKAMINDPASR